MVQILHIVAALTPVMSSACAAFFDPSSPAPRAPPRAPLEGTMAMDVAPYCGHCARRRWPDGQYTHQPNDASIKGVAVCCCDEDRLPAGTVLSIPGYGIRTVDNTFLLANGAPHARHADGRPHIRVRLHDHGAWKHSKLCTLPVRILSSPEEITAEQARLAAADARRSRRASGWEHFAEGLAQFTRSVRNFWKVTADIHEFSERAGRIARSYEAARKLQPYYETGRAAASWMAAQIAPQNK